MDMDNHDLTPAQPHQPLTSMQPAILTPMQMLMRAVESGAGVEVLERLMQLHQQWQAHEARRAFDAAIAAAKAELPVIGKNKVVDFVGKTGIRTHYRHETLDQIARMIDPILARHGLAYRFRVRSEPNEPVAVTCMLSHRNGHAEETTLTAPRDESGNKNNIQAIGSTVTYLQRYTLKAALGLAAAEDDDGNGGGDASQTISDEQVERLIAMCNEVGADIGKLCKYLGVDGLPELPAERYKDAVAALEAKRAKAAAAPKRAEAS
jgi:hypothetical protein